MIRIQRFLYYILILVFFVFISITLLTHLKTPSPDFKDEHFKTTKKVNPNEEKYLSWFPHSDFPEQQESFRNALRLALETKRTIIAPMLRINKIYPWMPFEDLAKRYEAQEKSTLKKACDNNQPTWQTALEPCETINDWIEIPWSSIMDLEIIKREYGIRIIERTNGHGWGVHESALESHIDPEDVAIIDVMSFKENGTDWEHIDPTEEALKLSKQSTLTRFTNWIQSHFTPPANEKLSQPLKFVLSVDRLHAIDAKIIQFGALNSAARYETTQNEIQSDLRKALMKSRFIVPDQMAQLTAQSSKIIEVLGGRFQFSTLILNLSKLVAMDARAGTIQNMAVDSNQIDNRPPPGMEDLNEKSRWDLMEAVVLELFGDIPINQAVSAAMPIKPSSTLAALLNSGFSTTNRTSPQDRFQLLEACVDYHRHVEERYPVYYLINDMQIAAETRPDIFGPLLEMFPCIFSKADMISWGIQTDSYLSGQPGLIDTHINYEQLFQPLLDILIAQKGYSFFEIPTTPLTRFLNWSPKE
ncbi:uncharacterized protein BX663DRAFT_556520 [Cokeromyces recurvatus]|uniref:uncharacterized protein n=1 Tax=Cokeromyces recurvatus TaxID=90255 RepID=UPI00221E70AD|nr:uncharacterized protein BX663DRAFT_556520 [Cokeromyces recurvatus]KAI7897671.1 hypothetical protein BX663DRAFT_556520 [Cokeromyces recurvatus]